ncbi:MAG: hypothetical protein IKV47_05995 [Oscillospiraceae bacterium]|nr:hypothetical protein [Oscillospiraceae bacterium]
MEPYDQLPDAPQQEKKESQQMTSGQWLWKTAKPIGCIVILLMFVAFLVFFFTSKPPEAAAAAGYELCAENFAVDKSCTIA